MRIGEPQRLGEDAGIERVAALELIVQAILQRDPLCDRSVDGPPPLRDVVGVKDRRQHDKAVTPELVDLVRGWLKLHC